MHVTIVGAGITGLALAHHLAREGVAVTVFEADDEPGGVVRSVTVDGHVLELGPQRTRLASAVADLVAELGLEPTLRRAPDASLSVYHAGARRRVPTTPRSAVTTDLLSWRGRLRMLGELVADGPRADETVAEYFERAFGREAARRFIGPLYAGLYAGDPHAMPARYTVARALEARGLADRSVLAYALRATLRGRDRPPAISFDRGLQTLAHALAAEVGEHVRFEQTVTRLERATDGRLAVSTADDRIVTDRVVLTVPAPVAGSLVATLGSQQADTADALRNLTYNPLAVVHLSAAESLEAAGYQVSLDVDLVTRGVTSNAHLFDRDAIHTAFLGGATCPEAVAWTDDRLGRTAAAEFANVTDIEADPIAVHHVDPGMPAYDGTWDALADAVLPGGVVCCANWCGRAGIPGRLRRARALADRLLTSDEDQALQQVAGPSLA